MTGVEISSIAVGELFTDNSIPFTSIGVFSILLCKHTKVWLRCADTECVASQRFCVGSSRPVHHTLCY